MVLGADQDKDAAAGPVAAWPRIGIAAGAARTAGSRAGRRAMAAVSCAALLAGLAAAAPAAVAAVRGHGAATAGLAAVPGSQLWASRLNGGFARALAVSPGGATVFVTGNSFGGTSGSDYATVAYDAATGAQRWASRYNGPANRDDYALSVTVSPDGATGFVTGASFGGRNRACCHSDWDYATVAYDAATGAQRWASRYNGPGNVADQASSVAVSPGGATVFVTGNSFGGASSTDYATVAYNAATGARRWVSRYNGPANRADLASSVAVSPGGATVFVTGKSRGATSGQDYATQPGRHLGPGLRYRRLQRRHRRPAVGQPLQRPRQPR